MLNKLKNYIQFNLHRYAHVAFTEPILVIESDDWGKTGMEHEVELPTHLGKRTPHWSYDRLENAEELLALQALLASYRQSEKRGPVFTANFIISNPDVEATAKTDFKELILKPIDLSHPELVPHWKKGIEENVFYPQYHGRLHYHPARYLQDLKSDEKLRKLFLAGINGGRELFTQGHLGYYSEYQHYANERVDDQLNHWIKTGVADFERLFGYKSTTTVCPNYVVDIQNLAIFKDTGVRFLQAGNKILCQKNGREVLTNFCQGSTLTRGLTALARNHKFEPCRQKQEWNAPFSITSAKGWMASGIPAVLDSHRMNYVAQFAEKGRDQLKQLLDELVQVPNIRFLTSPELGEAITNNGRYTDVFTGEKIQLTKIDSPIKRKLRARLH